MRRPTPTIRETCLAGLLLCAAFAFPGAAQTNSTSPSNPSGQNAESSSQASSPAPAQPAAKKVWTNDDVNGLRADSPISTIGKPARPVKDGAKQTNSKAKGAAWYQGRITKLEAELPPIDDQIAQLQAALKGQTVNSVRQWGGVKPDDWRVELDNLQKKHDDIEAQIAALKDEARHDGVPPSALP